MQLRQSQPEESERDRMVSYGSNMAADARKVRVEQLLKVKIGEAKNLAGRNSSTGGNAGVRNVFVTIALDQEEICRTPAIERTSNTFIGEEYTFDIPRKFRYLSVYVWDGDRHLKQDKPIGKVAIRREELHTYNHKDHWFSLRPVDADSEVQGIIHVLTSFECQKKNDNDEWLSFDENRSSISSRGDLLGSWQSQTKRRTPTHVKIRVPECSDLAKKNGTCDPFVTIVAEYTNNKKITKRTKVRKKTDNPKFDESFYFDLVIDNECKQDSNHTYRIHPCGGADLNQVVISMWHDTSVMGENVFLGEIKLPMRGQQQQNAVQPDAWYYLQPRTSHSRPNRSCATPPGTRLSCDNSIGSLRLNLFYTADHVFPLATYDRLMHLLIESIYHRPTMSSSVYILGEVVQNKADVAQPLVRLFTFKNLIGPIIKVLADHEISHLTDPTTIFRGNTLVSKMMDEAMRLSGLHYLHNTLRPVLEVIFSERKPCEIDPTRVTDKSAIRTNLSTLQDYVERVFNAIIKSAVRCPTVLCQIFHDLRECAAKHFPMNKEVRYSVVSGFIFLRFFAPAILGPKLFDLTTEKLDPQTTRTLTLISKTIQSLGNLVSSRSAQHTCKEEYMEELYKKFCTEKHLEAVKHFLEVISTVGTNNSKETILDPVLLKEGMMTKRTHRQRRFGRRNFKQRYFKLTTQSLSYAKSKGKRPICDIPLYEILAVERSQEQSFKLQNIFQIIRKDHTLYVQTTNCVEEKEWFDLLSKICQSNAQRLECFHPCAYINGMWSCCESSDGNAPGCRQVSNKPFQMELATALDPSRDLQRLHTLIISHRISLETKYKDDPVCQELLQAAFELEEIHHKHKQQLLLQTKYGSQMAPIGEDNYLNVMRHHQQQQILQQQQYQRFFVG